MRGYIKKLSSKKGDSWRIAVFLGKNESGKKKYHWETFRGNKGEADLRLNELLLQNNKGLLVKSSKQPLGQYLDWWLENIIKPKLAPRTHEIYSDIIKNHIKPTIGAVLLEDIKPQMLETLLSDKKKAGLTRTTQIIRGILHKSLNKARTMGLLAFNPVDGTEHPQSSRRQFGILDKDKLKIVQEALNESEYKVLFITLLHCGIRRSEALALRWSDIDLDEMVLSVSRSMQYLGSADPGEKITFKEPKTKSGRRTIALTPTNCVLLREHKESAVKQRKSLNQKDLTNDDLIFSHWNGQPFTPNGITHAWIKFIRSCGINNVRLHDLRHTMASIMLSENVHPKIVQERLGHAKISTTLDTYSHVVPGLQKASAKKLDDAFKGHKTKKGVIKKKEKDCKILQTPK